MDLHLLGPLEVVSGAGATVELGGRNQRAVLAMLLINRRTLVVRDRIIDGVWGDNLPSDPVNTLQHYVSRLRSILEPVTGGVDGRLIQRLDDGYRLDVPPEWVDADRFVESLEAATEARRRGKAGEVDRLLATGLAEWRGEPFEDLTYLDFLQPEIRRLNEQRLDGFEELFEARLAMGRHRESVAELADLANRHPLRERFWHQLMLALYRSGRQAEALRAYQEARRRLVQDLGIDPGPGLVALEEQILLGDPALHVPAMSTPLTASPSPPAIPVPLTTFIGRQDPLQQLAALLDERRLITIMGSSGIGKTRLAIETAHKLADRFDDGVRLVSFDTITDPDLVAPTMASAVELHEDPDRDFADTLADHVAHLDMLLVLDGCEQVATTCAQLVAGIQSHGTGLKVLVTSQVALGVEGEIRFDLAPMRADGANSDAVALFIDRARLIVPEFHPTSDEQEAIARICRTLDGSPLAIELAAARTDILSVAEIEADLGDGFDLSAQQPLLGSIRHRTLNDAIRWSLQLLDDQERDALEALTVFTQGFDLAAARAVAFPSRSIPDVTAILTRLAAKSFLRVERHTRGLPPRFNAPPALHAFARHRHRGRHPQRADQLSARHATWYADLARTSSIELRGPHHQRWLRMIHANHANLSSAMTWALESKDAGLLDRIVGHIARYWDWNGHIAEAVGWLHQALALNPRSDNVERGWVLIWAGYFTAESGDIPNAEQLAHEAIVIADQHHHTQQQTAARGNLGIIKRQTGRLPEAITHGQEAVDIATAAGDDWFHAWAATALAVTKLHISDTQSAEKLGQASQEIFRRLGDQAGEAWSLDILAQVAVTNNDLDTARSLARDALLYAHLLGAQRTLIWTLEVLAQVAQQQDEPTQAVQLLSAANTLRKTPTSAQATDLSGAATTTANILRATLTATEYSTAWSEGQNLDLEAVLYL